MSVEPARGVIVPAETWTVIDLLRLGDACVAATTGAANVIVGRGRCLVIDLRPGNGARVGPMHNGLMRAMERRSGGVASGLRWCDN